jgi:altronate dehydratase
MKADVIVINDADNVAVAMREITTGTRIGLPRGDEVTAVADVPVGHKIALVALRQGDPVIKYGESIGAASVDISAGDWVHTHNIRPV